MSGFAGLAGSYTLHPGAAVSITGHRPVLGQGLLTRLLRGQSGDQVERTLAALFTLCSHAHRRAARLALNAARLPDQVALSEPSALLLTPETVRDHLRSIALDWPRQLAQLDLVNGENYISNQPLAQDGSAPKDIDSEALNWLRACPLPLAQPAQALNEVQTQEVLMALHAWLQDCVLHQPLEDWLAHHRAPEVLAHWCHSRTADLPPARFLAACHTQASALSLQGLSLEVLDLDAPTQAVLLADLAQHITTQAGFAQFPTWSGQCQETGPWTRLRHRLPSTDGQSAAATSAWTRLASRWLELIELVFLGTQRAHDAGFLGSDSNFHAKHLPPAPLASGALNLAPGQAIAWVEMARGLLLHWVQLDEQGKVADYRVIAPTEWNFHPEGALALALSALPPDDAASAWVLAAAYDACVECSVAVSST
ncbi:MAG: nickel-dependent hydrogenase large subunit [Rhodoferax sp.]|uniref:nickel-dependent hydrogenase large subunit n=1 Tax=Rhodoferax sp. TaxID=50421 RepID=UPI001B60DE05|nr:nickel-dependent hydrogenase large subunit [Rhodoferax sp.]MBP9905432.1 nickel-dependent hydrogenase large subunit [Rhodoferax sp.]